MIRDLKHLLVVVRDDKVVAFSTNYKNYISKLKEIEAIKSQIKSETTMKRYFNKNNILTYIGSDRKIYTLQKVL